MFRAKTLLRAAAILSLTAYSTLCLTPQTPSAGSALSDGKLTQINGKPLSDRQRTVFVKTYGAAPPPGNYWYDALSGYWGYWGREPSGVINQGHDFGPLPANASGGNTGVFINGRQINLVEKQFYESIYNAPVNPARLWLDGRTGYFGLEGNNTPIGNLALAIQAKKQQQSSGCKGVTSRDAGSRTETSVYLGCD